MHPTFPSKTFLITFDQRKKSSSILWFDPFTLMFWFYPPTDSSRQDGTLELLRVAGTLTLLHFKSSCLLIHFLSHLPQGPPPTPHVCCFHKSKSTSVLKSAASRSAHLTGADILPSYQVQRGSHLPSHSAFAIRHAADVHGLVHDAWITRWCGKRNMHI